MTRNAKLTFGVAAVFAALMAFAIGPLAAAYAIAGVSLAFIAVLMVMRTARAFSDWRLGHPGKRHQAHRGSTVPEEDKRAA